MVQAMRAWADCNAGYECFPSAKLNAHDKWNHQVPPGTLALPLGIERSI